MNELPKFRGNYLQYKAFFCPFLVVVGGVAAVVVVVVVIAFSR